MTGGNTRNKVTGPPGLRGPKGAPRALKRGPQGTLQGPHGAPQGPLKGKLKIKECEDGVKQDVHKGAETI